MNDLYINCMKQECCTFTNTNKVSKIISSDLSITIGGITASNVVVDYELIDSWYKSLWNLVVEGTEVNCASVKLDKYFITATPLDRKNGLYTVELAKAKEDDCRQKGEILSVINVDMINLINFGNNLLLAAKYVTTKIYG